MLIDPMELLTNKYRFKWEKQRELSKKKCSRFFLISCNIDKKSTLHISEVLSLDYSIEHLNNKTKKILSEAHENNKVLSLFNALKSRSIKTSSNLIIGYYDTFENEFIQMAFIENFAKKEINGIINYTYNEYLISFYKNPNNMKTRIEKEFGYGHAWLKQFLSVDDVMFAISILRKECDKLYESHAKRFSHPEPLNIDLLIVKKMAVFSETIINNRFCGDTDLKFKKDSGIENELCGNTELKFKKDSDIEKTSLVFCLEADLLELLYLCGVLEIHVKTKDEKYIPARMVKKELRKSSNIIILYSFTAFFKKMSKNDFSGRTFIA